MTLARPLLFVVVAAFAGFDGPPSRAESATAWLPLTDAARAELDEL